ncbi:L-rhamnose/proton symporter RhaT, partial [Serratia marcescens]|uniref:L-rhamnose/proton symporter RhaT n=1 Tax=Serratia marcescens TaxID=615 RepID=UPI003C701BE7
SALGGLMWYLQFFFYAWGHASIPAQYDYMSWMLNEKISFLVAGAGAVTRRRAGGDHADGQPKAVYFWSVKYRYSLSDGLQQ